MKGAVITSPGIENYCAEEIMLLAGCAASSPSPGLLVFDYDDYLRLCKLCYCSQTAGRVMHLLFEVKISSDLSEALACFSAELVANSKDLSFFTAGVKSFGVVCERNGEHGFNSAEMEKAAADSILRLFDGKGLSFSYKSQDLLFYFFIVDDKGYFGVDFAARDLSKRQYRLFNSPSSVKSTLAAAVVLACKPKPEDTLLDPFSLSGPLSIEAAHFMSGKPVNFYSKEFAFTRFAFLKQDWAAFFAGIDSGIRQPGGLKIFNTDSSAMNIASAKKNAKVAGVEKMIEFSRTNLEDLDLKFSKESVDHVITMLPSSSKNTSASKVHQMYGEFFRQCSLLLKKSSRIFALCAKDEISSISDITRPFSIAKAEQWHSGQRVYYFYVLKRE